MVKKNIRQKTEEHKKTMTGKRFVLSFLSNLDLEPGPHHPHCLIAPQRVRKAHKCQPLVVDTVLITNIRTASSEVKPTKIAHG